VQPWGRIEGTLKVGSKAKAGEVMSVHRQEQAFQQHNAPRIYHDMQSSTDGEGRFAFDRVPPGRVTVALQVKLSPNTTGSTQSTYLDLKPGETARVEVGGKGRPIAGKVAIPDALKGKVNWAISHTSLNTKARMPQPKLPEDWATMAAELKQKWHDAWMKSPDGQANQKAQQEMKYYAVRVEGDNTFRVEDVLPGTYQLSVNVQEPNSENRWGGESIGQGLLEFTVPEMPGGRSDEVLDVGTLQLKALVRLKAGDAAPVLKFKTFDGKEQSLDELKGKYVVVDFWAAIAHSWVQDLPKLKEAHAAYAKDERVVFLGVNMDTKSETGKAFVEKNQIAWRQGFIGDWSNQTVPLDWGLRTMPSMFLIGPDGKVIAKELTAATVKDALAAALGAK
jgi:hypothetical protein